ncbi:MAG: sigma 54-interacting transcriptional regulator [Planctomycetota bacterium]|nr:sigma 54-interacting transcriptional regulator [Planctomycetota bacterium]
MMTSIPSDGCVLVYADSEVSAHTLRSEVVSRGCKTFLCWNVSHALEILSRETIDVCLIDNAESCFDAAKLVSHATTARQSTQIIGLVNADSPWGQEIIPSFRCEILRKPYHPTALGQTLFSAIEKSRLIQDNVRLKQQISNDALVCVSGQSEASRRLREQIQQAAPVDEPVFIHGETGTELVEVAECLHRAGGRSKGPLIRINCGVHSNESFERELFGAPQTPGLPGTQSGQLDNAEGGTLYLNEVESISIPLQRRLLRLLSQQSWQSQWPRTAPNVRVVASSQGNVEELLRSKQLDQSFCNWICGRTIEVPSLRERKADIVPMLERMIQDIAIREGQRPRRVPIETIRLLEGYSWPGNVQELRNVIERACSLDTNEWIMPEQIEAWLSSSEMTANGVSYGMTVKEMERKLIEATFSRFQGNREKTAQSLQIGLRTLSGKLREYGYPPRGGPGSNQRPQLKVA